MPCNLLREKILRRRNPTILCGIMNLSTRNYRTINKISLCPTPYGNFSSDTYLAVRQRENGEEDESNLNIHCGGNLIFGNLNSQNKKY